MCCVLAVPPPSPQVQSLATMLLSSTGQSTTSIVATAMALIGVGSAITAPAK